jgi:hypothetical protein
MPEISGRLKKNRQKKKALDIRQELNISNIGEKVKDKKFWEELIAYFP